MSLPRESDRRTGRYAILLDETANHHPLLVIYCCVYPLQRATVLVWGGAVLQRKLRAVCPGIYQMHAMHHLLSLYV